MEHKNTKKIIASVILIVGVMIIPLIYSGFYLASVWDAYGNMDDLPVAVVNNDKGAVIDGEETNLGQQLVDTMAEDKTLDWSFVDEETAQKGLQTGNVYYAVIEIPEDFSEKIASADSTEKSPATITYSSNEKRNYIASTIMKSAMLTLKDSVKSSVSEQISESLVQQLEAVPTKLETLEDGLSQLSDGANTLQDGMQQLSDGGKSLTENLQTLTSGLSQAESGAGQINDALVNLPTLVEGAHSLETGAQSVADGAAEVNDGVTSLLGGAAQLNEGAQSLQSGISQVSDGADNLTNGIYALSDGVNTLSDGVTQLSGGIDQSASGAATLSAGAASLDENLQAYVAQVNQIMAASGNSQAAQQMAAAGEALLSGSAQVSAGATNLSGALSQLSEGGQQLIAGVDQVSNGVTQVGAGAEALENGLTQLSGGASSLTDGMSTLSGGISSLSTGTEALAQGSATLAEGATTLSEGASQLTALQSGVSSLTDALGQLTDGAVQLTEGSQTLSDGIDSAKDGAAQLGDGIVTAKDGVAESIASAAKDLQKTDGLSEFTGTSVSVDADPYDSVENYGSAFAPYFMNVSLWTGGLTMMMSIFLDYKRRMKLLSPDSDKPILRMLAFFGIAVGQAVLVGLTVQFILGLQINNVAMYYAGLILSSLTFTAIIQFLLIHVGDVGKIIAMVLLVFQLTSTGGTFPVEMTPSFFRFLHKLMPMTYGIQFEKEAISGTSYSYMGKNALVMLGFFAVFVAATLALDYWKLHRKKTHPNDDDLDYALNAPRLEQ